MTIVRSNKYRLYPNATQKAMLYEMFGMSRFAFNHLLGLIQSSHFGTTIVKSGKNKGNKVPSIPNQTGIVGFSTELKSSNSFMNKMPNDFIQGSLTNLHKATKGFFNGSGYPKFKSKHSAKQTISMYAGSRVKLDDGFIQLNRSKTSSYTKDTHKIKFKKHKTNHNIGKITGFTIEKDNLGLYWISVTHKIDIKPKKLKISKSVGIDLGIKDIVICSDGLTTPNDRITKSNEKKLSKESRRLSRRKKGSNNRRKQKLKVAKIHRKIKNQRNNRNHNITRNLVNIYDYIAVESLQVKNMIKNRRLSKAIQDVAWGDLLSKIEYKLAESQSQLSKIDKWFPSSKSCFVCGSVKDSLNLSERTYICENCGHKDDRDINAAKNILREGLRTNPKKSTEE